MHGSCFGLSVRNAAVCERSTRAFTVTMIHCLWSMTVDPRHLYQRVTYSNPARRRLTTHPRRLRRITPTSPQTAHLITLSTGVFSALLLSPDEKQYQVEPRPMLDLVRRVHSSPVPSDQTLCQVAHSARSLSRRLRTFTSRPSSHVQIL